MPTNRFLIVGFTLLCIANGIIAQLSIDVSVMQQPCWDADPQTGSIRVTISNGVQPYLVSVNGGPFSSEMDYSNVLSGPVTVLASDSSSPPQTASTTIELTPRRRLRASSIVYPSAVRPDRGTGGVRFQWAESDAPVTVKLDGDVNFPEYVPVPRTEMSYGGLRPGLWRFTMYDEVRCASVYVVEILRTIQLFRIRDVPACSNQAVGALKWGLYPGAPPYTWHLMRGQNVPAVRPDAIVLVTYSLEVEFTELTRDWWTVIVFDSAGKTSKDSWFLDFRPLIGMRIDRIQDDLGASDGAVDFVTTSGDGPLQYLLNGNAPQTPSETGANFAGLSAGEYTLRVSDIHGCNATYNVRIGSTMSVTSGTLVPTCSDAGQIPVIVTGGVPPYEFQLLPSIGEEPTPPQTGSVITGVRPGRRTVLVRDSRRTEVSLTVDVPLRDSSISLNVVPTSNSRDGEADGAVEITAINAAEPVIYSVVTTQGVVISQTTGSFSGLRDGIYTARIYDYYGCGKDVIFRILPAQAPVAQPFIPACIGMSPGNGQILLALTEGVGPFNVTLGSNSEIVPGPTHTLTGLVAGSYVVFVEDSLFVRRNYSVTVPSYEFDVSTAFTFAPPVSNEGGTVTFRPNIDTYYEWQLDTDSSRWETPVTIFLNNVAVGTRTLTARDSRGCQRNVTFTIPDALSIILTATPISGTFCGKTRYTVTASVTGAPGPLQYRLATENIWKDGASFYDVAPPTATVFVRYSTPFGSYQQSATIALSEVARPGAFFIQGVSSSFATPDVASIATVSLYDELNDPLVDFEIDGSKYSSSPVIYGLSDGQHSVVAVDSSMCRTASTIFVIRVIEPLSAQILGTEPSCYDQSNGAINIGFSGGLLPITVLLNDAIVPAPGTSQRVNPVAPGKYKVTVRDSSSPSQILVFQDVVVAEHPPIIESLGAIPPEFFGEAGYFWVNTTGLSPPYSFSLIQDPDFPVAWSPVSDNTFEVYGNPTIDVTDGNGCVVRASFSTGFRLAGTVLATVGFLVPGEPLMACHGVDTEFEAFYNWGTPPYTLYLDGVQLGDPTSDISRRFIAKPGNHSFVVKDGSIPQQVLVRNFTVIEYPPFSISISKTATTGSDGVINAVVTWSAFPLVELEFELTGPGVNVVQFRDGFFAGLPAGVYTLVVRDNSGWDPTYCSKSYVVDIVLQSLWSTNETAPLCAGSSTGSLTLRYSTETLTEPVTIVREGLGVLSSLNVTGLSAGGHRFVLTDSSQPPVRLTLATSLADPAPIAAYVHVVPINPSAPAQGSYFSLFATGGTGSYQYDVAVLSLQSSIPRKFTNTTGFSSAILPFGDIQYTITDSNGCKISETVKQNTPTAVTLSKPPTTICNGIGSSSFSVIAKGGLLPFSFTIEPSGNYTTVCTDFECSFSDVPAGEYWITAVDNSTLARFASLLVGVSSNTLQVRTSVRPATPGVADGILTIEPFGSAAGPFRFDITNPLGQSTVSNIGEFRLLAQGVYNYVVTSSQDGCEVSGSVSLPEVFTASISSVDPQSNCRSDGTIRLQVVGGTAPLSYFYNGEKFSSLRTDLSAGVYTVAVEDSSVPPRTILLGEVRVPARPAVSLEVETRRQNRDLEYGLAVIRVRDAVAPFSRFTIGSSNAVVGLNYGLAGGQFDVVLVDATGCTFTSVADVAVRDVVAAVAKISKPKCCGDEVSVELLSHPSWEYARVDLEIWQDSPVFSGLTPATFYSFFVREKLDPDDVQTVNVLIDDVPCLVLNSVTTVTRGTEQSLPKVKFEAQGQALKYYVDNLPPQETDVILVSPGPHDLRIVDGNGCEVTSTFSAISTPVVTALVSPSACTASNSSSVVIEFSGGVAPYQIRTDSDTVLNTTAFYNIKPGVYSWQVSDSGLPPWSAAVSFAVTVTQPLAWASKDFMYSYVTANQGAEFITPVVGGTAPYRFDLKGVTNSSFLVSQLSASFYGIPRGDYFLSVRDANGCQLTEFLKVFSRPVGRGTITSAFCSDSNLVWIAQLSATGGSGFLSFSTDPNSGFKRNGQFQNIGTTVRNGFVRDDLVGSVFAFDIPNFANWTQLYLPEPSIIPSTGSNGRITVSATGGVPPYTYSIGGPFSANNDFTNLAPGLYSIRVQDTLNCQYSRNVVVFQVGALSAEAVVTFPSCFGGSDGSITFNAQGAVPPYTYSFNGAASVLTNTFSGLANGTYSVTIADSASSSITFDTIVSQPSPVDFSWSLATGAAGTRLASQLLVFLSATGGRPAPDSFYDVTVNGAPTLVLYNSSAQTSPVPLTLTRYGAVDVTLKDAFGCSATRTVYYYDRPVVKANSTSISCFGSADGKIEVVNQGGSGNFSYRIRTDDPWGSSAIFTGLSQGEYRVEVLDNYTQFVSFATAYITQPTVLGISAVVSRRSSTGINGRLTATVTGGTGPFDITLRDSFMNVVYQGRETFWDYLADSAYSVSVTDARGCTASTPMIPLPADTTITTQVVPVACNGGSTGSIEVTGSGGDGNYQYAIATGIDSVDANTLVWSSSNTFSGLKVGTYTVYTKDGAIPTTVSHRYVQISQPAPLSVSFMSTGASSGASDGVLRIAAFGGTSPFEYQVNGAVIATVSGLANATGLAAGTHAIFITDSRGCTVSATATVYEKIVLSAQVTNVSCFGLSDGLVNITAVGGSGVYRYRLANRGSAAISFQATGKFGGLAAGLYSFYVEDSLDVAYSATLTGVRVASPISPVGVSVISKTRATFGASDATATLVATGGTGTLSIAVTNSTSSMSFNSGFASGLAGGFYIVKASDANGCTANVSMTIISTMQLTASSISESCSNAADGSVTLLVDGGEPPFTFKMMPDGAPQSSHMFERLASGNYSFRVTDSALPASFAEVNVTVAAPIPLRPALITTWRNREVLLKVEGGNGGPYQSEYARMFLGRMFTSEIYFSGPFPRRDVITDGRGCSTPISNIAPVNDIEASFRIAFNCTGAGPARYFLADPIVTGGVAPFKFFFLRELDGASREFSFDAASQAEIPYDLVTPPFVAIRVVDAEQYSIIVRLPYGRNPRSVTASTLVARTASASMSGLLRVWVPDEDWYGSLRLRMALAAVEDESTIIREVVGSQYEFAVPAGNYTITIRREDTCFAQIYAFVAALPGPTINEFACAVNPVAGQITCDANRVNGEEYAIYLASSSAPTNVSNLAFTELSRFYGCGLCYNPLPLQIRVVNGKYYYAKLTARNVEGTSSSVIETRVTLARPATPSTVRIIQQSQGNLTGILLVWDTPSNPAGSFLKYDVMLKPRESAQVISLASGLVDTSLFVNSSLLDSLPITPSTFVDVIVATFSVTFDLASLTPEAGSQGSFQYYRTPAVPQGFVFAFETIAATRSLVVSYLLPLSGAETSQIQVQGRDTSVADSSWTPMAVDSGTRGNFVKTVLPTMAFGTKMAYRYIVANGMGWAAEEGSFTFAEPPPQANFTVQFATLAAAINTSIDRINCRCYDFVRAAGTQGSRFRFEFVVTEDASPNWQQAQTSPTTTGGVFVVDVPADGKNFFVRCVAENDFGWTYARALSESVVLLPLNRAVAAPTNVRLVSMSPSVVGPVNTTWTADWPNTLGSPIVRYEMKYIGFNCRDEEGFAQSSLPQVIIYQRRECPLYVSARVVTERGPSPWAVERAAAWINLPPSPPFFDLELPDSAVTNVDANVLVSVVISSLIDSSRNVSLEVSSNITGPVGELWTNLQLDRFVPVARVGLSASGENTRLGDRVVRSLEVRSFPVEYLFRAYAFNGNFSEPVQRSIVVIGRPQRPNITSTVAFDPTNSTVTLRWERDTLENVTYVGTLTVTSLQGEVRTVQAINTAETFLVRTDIVAGDSLVLSLVGKTALRESLVATHTVVAVSGSFWETNATYLAPSLTRFLGMNVTLVWRADRSRHGFARTSYIVRRSVPGSPTSFVDIANLVTPEPSAQDTFEFVFIAPSPMDGIVFSVTPYNPRGSGPTSLLSASQNFYRNLRDLPAVQGRPVPARVVNRATLLLSWPPVPNVDLYSILLESGSNDQLTFANIPCCTYAADVTPFSQYTAAMAVTTAGYGRFPAGSTFIRKTVLPYSVGVPDAAELVSVTESNINSTGATMIVTLDVGWRNLSRFYIPTIVVSYSLTGSGSWNETVFTTYSESETLRTVMLRLPLGECYDFRVYLISPFGSGGYSNILSRCSVEAPRGIMSVTIDESLEATSDDAATYLAGWMLPFSFEDTAPFGGDVTEYKVSLPGNSWGFTEVIVNPPERTSEVRTVRTRIPVNAGRLQRIEVTATNKWGSRLVHTQDVLLEPALPVRNVVFIANRPQIWRPEIQELEWSFETIVISTGHSPMRIWFPNSVAAGTTNVTIFQRGVSDWRPEVTQFFGIRSECRIIAAGTRWYRCRVVTELPASFFLPERKIRIANISPFNPFMNASVIRSYTLDVDVSRLRFVGDYLVKSITPPFVAFYVSHTTQLFDEEFDIPLVVWTLQYSNSPEVSAAIASGNFTISQVINGVRRTIPRVGPRASIVKMVGDRSAQIEFPSIPGTLLTTVDFSVRQCDEGNTTCVTFTYRDEEVRTAPGYPPVPTLLLDTRLSSTFGGCVVNLTTRYKMYEGADVILRSRISVVQTYSSYTADFFGYPPIFWSNPNGAISARMDLLEMNFYRLNVALETQNGFSGLSRPVYIPSFVCAPPRAIVGVSRTLVNAGGGLELTITLDPPIPERFKDPFKVLRDELTRALVEEAQVRFGDSIVARTSVFNNVRTPSLPEGPVNVSFSHDRLFWGSPITIFVIPAPFNATIVAPSFVRVPDFGAVTVSHPGFAGSDFVSCEWEGLAIVSATPVNENRTTWSCFMPAFVPPIPRPTRLNYFSDTRRYVTDTIVTFWDAAAVSATLSTDTVDSLACSTVGLSHFVLSVSRWPFPPASRPIYVFLTSLSPDFPDTHFLVFNWNETAGAFTTPFVVLFPGTYDVVLTESIVGGARMARSLFVHSADCNPARAACLTKRDRASCFASSGCTWVSVPRFFGACGLVGDGTAPATESYVSSVRIKNTGILPAGRTVVFRYLIELPVINDGSITGTMNLSCVAPTLRQRLPATTVVFLPFTATYSHTCEFLVDPVWERLTGTFEARAEYHMTNPDLFGSRFASQRVSFRIGMNIAPQKTNENGMPLIIPPLRVWPQAPIFRASFVNHLLVSSLEVSVRLNNDNALTFGLSSRYANNNLNATLVRPREPIFVDLRTIPYRFIPPGIHRIVVTVNRGNELEETAEVSFSVPVFPEAVNWFFTVAQYIPQSSSNCHNRVSGLRVCLDVAPESEYDSDWEVDYPTRILMRLGGVYDPSAMLQSNNDPRQTAEARVSPSRGTENFRVSIELAFSMDLQGVISVGLYLDVTIVILGQDRRVTGDGQARAIFVPSTNTEPPKLEFLSAQAIITFPAFELNPTGEYPTNTGGFYFRLSFRSEFGLLVKVCNPRFLSDPDCYFPIADGMTGGFGAYLGVILEARAGYSIPIFLDISLSTEGSLSVWGTAVKPIRGGRVGVKVCLSVTVFFFISRTDCPASWYTSYGDPFPNTRGYLKRNTDSGVTERLIQNPGWTHSFTPFAMPQSWASKSKRSVPVADEGVLVFNTVPVARPSTSAGRGPSRGLALIAWTGFDSGKPVPYGSMIMYSVYNSSNEQLSDPVSIRSTDDVDGGSFVYALSDGRWLVLASVLPNQGVAAISTASARYTELYWATFNVSTTTFSAFAALTTDGLYYDGHPSAAEFIDQNSASPTFGQSLVLVTWARMRDSNITFANTDNDIMYAIFDPQANTWSAPSVIVANVGFSDTASVAAVNRTVVLTYSDKRNDNQTYAKFIVYDSRDGSWSDPLDIGQNFVYASVPGSVFDASMWEPAEDIPGPRQQFITVSSKDDSAFVIVWSEDNSIFSRIYSITELDDLANGWTTSHPAVQFVWAASGITPQNIFVTDVSGETNKVGLMMSWQHTVGGIFYRSQLVMLPLADYWEAQPVVSASAANFTVLATSVFVCRDDTAFVINSEQELVYDVANDRQVPETVSITYKRINLLPILLLQNATVTVPTVARFEGNIYDVSVLIENRGAFPASNERIATAHGSFDSYTSLSEESASFPLPPMRGGLNYTTVIASTPITPLSDGGYIWVRIVNSSAVPVRVPLFTSTFSNMFIQPSDSAPQATISVSVSCRPLLVDLAFADLYAGAPVSFFTVEMNSTKETLLGQVVANCSLDPAASAATVSLTVPIASLHEKIIARGVAQDDHVVPAKDVATSTISVKIVPDLVVLESTVRIIKPFIGAATSVARIDNTGLRTSHNVTVKLTNTATGEVIGAIFVSNITGLSSFFVEFPIPRSVITNSGLYDFTWTAMSDASALAWREARLYDVMINSPLVNASQVPVPDRTHLENSYADNFYTLRNVRMYDRVALRIPSDSIALSIDESISLHVLVSNAHATAGCVDVPILSFISSAELERTLIAESTLSVGPMSSVVVSLTPLASVASTLKYYEQIGDDPTITIVVPAMFSGSDDPIIVTVPLETALDRNIPSVTVEIDGIPAIQVSDFFSLSPGQFRTATVEMINIPAANRSSFSLRLLSGGSGVAFNDQTSQLSYTAPTETESAFSESATIGLMLNGGVLFESKRISFQVVVPGLLANPFDVVYPPGFAPPVAPPVNPPIAPPTKPPVAVPVAAPVKAPVASPFVAPTAVPTPVAAPTATPVASPTVAPVASPFMPPIVAPAATPTGTPQGAPPSSPISAPIAGTPVSAPAATPQAVPVASPPAAPGSAPIAAPVGIPVSAPEATPQAVPVASPPAAPGSAPIAVPQASPASSPTASPIGTPVTSPVATPASMPTAAPKAVPSAAPVVSAPTNAAPVSAPTQSIMFFLEFVRDTPLTIEELSIIKLSLSNIFGIPESSIVVTWSSPSPAATKRATTAVYQILVEVTGSSEVAAVNSFFSGPNAVANLRNRLLQDAAFLGSSLTVIPPPVAPASSGGPPSVAPSTPTSPPASDTVTNTGLSAGAQAGIAIVVVLLILGAIGAVVFVVLRRKDMKNQQEAPLPRPVVVPAPQATNAVEMLKKKPHQESSRSESDASSHDSSSDSPSSESNGSQSEMDSRSPSDEEDDTEEQDSSYGSTESSNVSRSRSSQSESYELSSDASDNEEEDQEEDNSEKEEEEDEEEVSSSHSHSVRSSRSSASESSRNSRS